ncbi:MAG: hypothetical protein KatS3mg068_0068 [Candidatus Sericytochromatia bacterium]|nr:MAG: hypothetical protein KatS3mg068_0068 [Candidatus Sericytochromatia bacterium]
MKERYINPFTDFGFKKLFGEEANKDLIIDFLNSLLENEHKVVDLTFKKTDHRSFKRVFKKVVSSSKTSN